MWIKRRIQKEEEAISKSESIRRNATAVYDELWKKIMDDLSEAQSQPYFKTTPPGTSGAEYERIVYMPNGKGRRRECRLVISDDKTKIMATTNDVEQSFDIGVRADGIGFLSQRGTTISYERASQLILEPLLFGDLTDNKDS
jgi:hypothetical protein